MQRFFRLNAEQKYRIVLLLLLAVNSGIAVALLIARVLTTHSHQYSFLIGNLILAWIPFIMAWIVYASRRLPKTAKIILTLISAGLWLLFLPNAAYLLTDFQHLLRYRAAPVWYDILMLAWFGWSGLLLGIFSLYLMQEIVAANVGKKLSWVFVALVTALNGVGVYLGRFLRWNSWDVFDDPTQLFYQFMGNTFSPTNVGTMLVFIPLFSLFFLMLYGTIYVFGHLMSEHQVKSA